MADTKFPARQRKHEPTFLGRQLHAYRRAHGLSQKAMAEKMGLKEQPYSNIEGGRVQNPHIACIAKAADFFGVSIDELYGPALQVGYDPAHTGSAETITLEIDLRAETVRVLSRVPAPVSVGENGTPSHP